MRLSWLALVAVVLLSGCNTLREHNYEKIMVRTPGVDNAYCDLTTDKNRYTVMSSRQVVVERSDMPLTVICRKTGYYTASVVVNPELYAPGMPLNLANGMLPGAAYDIASNSIYVYPETIIIILLPEPAQKQVEEAPYVLQKKPEYIKATPKEGAPSGSSADKSLMKSGRK